MNASDLTFAALFVGTPGNIVLDAITFLGWDSLGTDFAFHAPRAPRVEEPVPVVEWDPAEWASRDR